MNIGFFSGVLTKIYTPTVTNNYKVVRMTLKVVDKKFESYYNISFWNDMCDRALQELKEGYQILVMGKVNKKFFKEKPYIEVNCADFELLNTNGIIVENDNDFTEKATQNNHNEYSFNSFSVDDDDLPF